MKYTRFLPLAILIARFIGDAANHIQGLSTGAPSPDSPCPHPIAART